MLLVCVCDSRAGKEFVMEGETLVKDKEHVLFLKTNDYWQRKQLTVILEYNEFVDIPVGYFDLMLVAIFTYI